VSQRSPFLVLAYVSLAVSTLSSLTWILVNPFDPHDDPRLWVGILTFLWHFMLSPIAFLIAVVGGVSQRKKHPAWRTTGVATLALLIPFIGQILAYTLWGSDRGPFG
jgi:hypothetical protein